jgi:hypothetical protein
MFGSAAVDGLETLSGQHQPVEVERFAVLSKYLR